MRLKPSQNALSSYGSVSLVSGNGRIRQSSKDFSRPLPQNLLNIEEKSRSNLFAWRGQFSPQLVESLLSAYCPDDAVVLDPFAGSGTVLLEAARFNLAAFGFEINPSAWTFAKLYEFANLKTDARGRIIEELRRRIDAEFPLVLFQDDDFSESELEERVIRIGHSLSDKAKVLCNALVVLLDIFKNKVTSSLVQSKFSALAELVLSLPFSDATLKADLQDARSLPLDNQSVDFVLTSPPYINVFNYHQNYRRSIEVLGWDPLRVARSEIGSNRANRGNRFLTVIQYCIDMADALQESARVLKPGGRGLFILGYESNVLGVPFHNADIVERIAEDSGLFEMVQRQKRVFTNRFGKSIREDILSMRRLSYSNGQNLAERVGRAVAREALQMGDGVVDAKNKSLLRDAISRASRTDGTDIFDGKTYSNYHTRENVMMVKEERNKYHMSQEKINLPTPHLAKLKALLENRRLPVEDKQRLNEAVKRYEKWIEEMSEVEPGRKGAVAALVESTNRYKMFIELDLIFDSPKDLLYRQKGQLKLDNTILEEFLPQLMFRGLSLADGSFEFGPQKTFSGLSFTSGIGNPGAGGQATLRAKAQDFVLGKRLFMMTSFDKDFQDAERIEAHLGYVCAECKTNLDKTMFQEAVATSRDLKMAVPSSLYFLVCEFLDMTPVSITSTQIDDVLIVRKAKRMSSNVRQEFRSAEDRKNHRSEYVEFLESSKYHPDVFQRMIDKIQKMADDTNPAADKVLKRGFF